MKCEQVEAVHFCVMTDRALYTTGPLRHFHGAPQGSRWPSAIKLYGKMCRNAELKYEVVDFRTAAFALWKETRDN